MDNMALTKVEKSPKIISKTKALAPNFFRFLTFAAISGSSLVSGFLSISQFWGFQSYFTTLFYSVSQFAPLLLTSLRFELAATDCCRSFGDLQGFHLVRNMIRHWWQPYEILSQITKSEKTNIKALDQQYWILNIFCNIHFKVYLRLGNEY